METFADLPIKLFTTRQQWTNWLAANHHRPTGVWLKIAKKAAGKASVSYVEALEDAICYGWIDGQKQTYDEQYYLQKFTPRRPKSVWSKVNVAKAEALIATGKMQPAGLAAITVAKADGRWDNAYDSFSQATIPTDFLAALDSNTKAKAFFATLNKTNTYAMMWRIHHIKKPETRAAKIQQFIDMLERGEKLY